MSDDKTVLHRLMDLIHSRNVARPPGSYTTELLNAGVPKIGEKILEEATEVVEAAAVTGDEGRRQLIRETADLLFHLLVLLEHGDIKLSEVEAELHRREGTSGLEEKASRKRGP